MTALQDVPRLGPIARYEQEVVDRITDFNDPRQEWRRLFSEILGTFFLVLVACVLGAAVGTTVAACGLEAGAGNDA